jgi:hypothetical protein
VDRLDRHSSGQTLRAGSRIRTAGLTIPHEQRGAAAAMAAADGGAPSAQRVGLYWLFLGGILRLPEFFLLAPCLAPASPFGPPLLESAIRPIRVIWSDRLSAVLGATRGTNGHPERSHLLLTPGGPPSFCPPGPRAWRNGRAAGSVR